MDDDYKGPSLDGDKLTIDFMRQLMELYRSQGKLHRKFAYMILFQIRNWFTAVPSLVDITVPQVYISNYSCHKLELFATAIATKCSDRTGRDIAIYERTYGDYLCYLCFLC